MDFFVSCNPGTKVLQNLEEIKLKRQQDNIHEELSTISTRIENTLKDYEDFAKGNQKSSNSFFSEDLSAIEELLKDNILKNEYQQNLSGFIFDYKNLCSKRLEILTQISEFFSIYAGHGVDDVSILESSIASMDVHETLQNMEGKLQHLNGSSRNMLEYVGHLQRLTSNKSKKSKKKLEKAFQQNKKEVEEMTEKVHNLKQELKTRDERITMLKSQVDLNKTEVSVLNQHLTTLRNSSKTMEENLTQNIETLKKKLDDDQLTNNSVANNNSNIREVNSKLKEIRLTALNELQNLKQRIETESCDVIHKDAVELLRVLLEQMQSVHNEELDHWRRECVANVRHLLEIEINEDDPMKWMRSPDKEKPISPYHTSSVCSVAKLPSDEGESWVASPQSKPQPSDAVGSGEDAEEIGVRAEMEVETRLNEETEEQMKKEILQLRGERDELLNQVESLKQIQEATESEAIEALEKLEEITYNKTGTEKSDSFQNHNESCMKESGVSPSTFSQPASPTTGHSLVSAYRQKIASRKNGINRQSSTTTGAPLANILRSSSGSSYLEEHLRTYRAVIKFKDKVSEEMSKYSIYEAGAQALSDLPAANFDATDNEVQIDVMRMHTTIENTLDNIYQHLHLVFSSTNTSKLQQKISDLEMELSQTQGTFERRAQHDAAMIMHMQNTLSETQRGNTTAAGTSGSGFPSSPAAPAFGKSPGNLLRPGTGESGGTIMFTRQDVQHNEIALKRSAANGKIAQETFESISNTMAAYNAIPARRMRQLASKLVHHTTMKRVESSVRSSDLLTSEVFAILEKMEALQQRRAQQWSRSMDGLAVERQRLALLLMDALQRLENISGVFLIKPIVSYKGMGPMKKSTNKVGSHLNKHQMETMVQKMLSKKKSTDPPSTTQQGYQRKYSSSMLSGQLVQVSGLRRSGGERMWRVDDSISPNKAATDRKSPFGDPLSPMTRLAELDIARYRSGLSMRSTNPPGSKFVRQVRSEGEDSAYKSVVQTDQVRTAPNQPHSPHNKSSAPPTTPASPMIERIRVPLAGDDERQPLPPIRKSSLHSLMSSAASIAPPSITPSRSAPEFFHEALSSISPLTSSRKDMATSPACE